MNKHLGHSHDDTSNSSTAKSTLGKNPASTCFNLTFGHHELQESRQYERSNIESLPHDEHGGIREALAEAQRVADEEFAGFDPENGHTNQLSDVNMIIDDDEELIAATNERVRISVAMDSGSVDNVIHPKELPSDAQPVANTSGKHFVGANNSKIEKYGSCVTKLGTQHGEVGCDWQLAGVSRPLHSVSKVTGPKEHPTGKQDVLFNNKLCVVVPPGTVERILREVKPIAEYERQGNLYLAEMTMSVFRRQGQEA